MKLYFYQMSTVHLTVHGKVQGVLFRNSAKKMALQVGLFGWVRNTREGHVEMIVQGEKADIKKFMDWCSHGPVGARVENVFSEEITSVEFDEFKIMH